MSAEWKLQDAKNRFSEVVDKAQSEGPQEITRRGKKAAVVLSFEDYRKMKTKSTGTLSKFLRESPLGSVEFGRTKDFPREVHL